MDQNPTPINNKPINPKPNRLHALAFLKIGLFEIGFVGIFLLLLFGILNFFNILSVSDVFPQLSFLPRQQAPTPSPTNFTPANFQSDTQKAKDLLTQYIKDTLKPDFLPNISQVKEDLSGAKNNVYRYWLPYVSSEGPITVNLSSRGNSQTNYLNIIIQPIKKPASTMTPSLANPLLSLYFKNPPSISECKGLESITCENFQTTPDGKKGYGVYTTSANGQPMTMIFSCFIPKDSGKYADTNSCIGLY